MIWMWDQDAAEAASSSVVKELRVQAPREVADLSEEEAVWEISEMILSAEVTVKVQEAQSVAVDNTITTTDQPMAAKEEIMATTTKDHTTVVAIEITKDHPDNNTMTIHITKDHPWPEVDMVAHKAIDPWEVEAEVVQVVTSLVIDHSEEEVALQEAVPVVTDHTEAEEEVA